MNRAAPAREDPFARPDVVARYEEWYASPYGRLVDRIERALILDLLRPLAPGDSVVEIGCGTAHFAHALAERGFRAVGVDPSPPMLAVARTRLPVVCGTGESLPFADAAFEGALLVSVLEFASDAARLLREARRVAKRRVVVVTIERRSWLGSLRRLAGWRGHAVFSRARYRTRAEWLAAFRAIGVPVERTRSALVLPPSWAARFPRLEERLTRASPPGAGVVGFALPGTAPA